MVNLINLNPRTSRTRRPRPEDLPPWQPSKTTTRILRYLYRYRYLTTELLAFLYRHDHDQGSYQVRTEMTKLWRYGFVERFHRPTDIGSRQLVYALSVKGAREVIEAEDWPTERRKIYNRAEPKSDYEHVLAVSVLHFLWEFGSRHTNIFKTVTIWQDKDGTKDKTTNQFEAKVAGKNVNIQPDLTVLLAHQKPAYYRPYFFEVERTHKNAERLTRRFRAYDYLLSAVGHKAVRDVFSREGQPPPERGMVIFIGADVGHAERLRDLALTLVKPDTEFWFTSLDKLFINKPRRRRDGSVRKNPTGETIRLEEPIDPAEFFNRDLLVNLDGKAGCLVK